MTKFVRKNSKFIVYKITHIDSDKIYIGITTNYKRRIIAHFSCKDNAYLHKAIQKYGKNNFKYEIICKCNSWEDLQIKEIELIKQLNAKIPNGYNMTDGGDGCLGFKLSEGHKNSISMAQKGRKRSVEFCKLVSETRKKFTKDQIIEIKQRLFNGETQRKIANGFDVDQPTISDIKTGVNYSDIQAPGVNLDNIIKNVRCLTDKQVKTIKVMLSKGELQSKIAKVANVCTRSVSNIKMGYTYNG